jgi:ABC-type nitrate/sulfonate/bicarbonate transport system substrate-binding protein
MRLRSDRPLIAFLTAIVFFGAIPYSKAEAPVTVQGDGGKVRLLYSAFGTNSFPPYVMQKLALDKRHGFELVLVPAATDEARITALQADAGDVGTLDWHQVAIMRNAGVNVVGVAPFLRWGADFTVKPVGSPLRTIGDLKGKRFGVYSRTSLNWIIERTVAQKIYDLNLEQEATIQEASVPLLRGLLDQGQLDAAEMFNSQTPAMIATGKFSVLTKVSDLVHQLGLPDTPFLVYTMTLGFATAHRADAKAFVAAYRDAVEVLQTDDAIWIEHGQDMKFTPEVAALFRTAARTDLMTKFAPDTEADIKKVFAVLLANSSAKDLGLSSLPSGFLTLDYQ